MPEKHCQMGWHPPARERWSFSLTSQPQFKQNLNYVCLAPEDPRSMDLNKRLCSFAQPKHWLGGTLPLMEETPLDPSQGFKNFEGKFKRP